MITAKETRELQSEFRRFIDLKMKIEEDIKDAARREQDCVTIYGIFITTDYLSLLMKDLSDRGFRCCSTTPERSHKIYISWKE